jgi:hypothetical protein
MSQDEPGDAARDRRWRSQNALLEFLSADLDLAFTAMRAAQIDAGSDPGHSRYMLSEVRVALRNVRRFEGLIEDVDKRSGIHGQADQIESALNDFQFPQ